MLLQGVESPDVLSIRYHPCGADSDDDVRALLTAFSFRRKWAALIPTIAHFYAEVLHLATRPYIHLTYYS